MKKYGLIGYPLGHSFSKRYFEEKYEKENITDCQFDLYPIEKIDLVEELISSNENLNGFSVTIPYKEQIIPYLDLLDPDAEKIGAVNCVKIFRDKDGVRKVGFNTDVLGFRNSLRPFIHEDIKSALILGTGGAAKAIAVGLQGFGIDSKFVSRTPQFDDDLAYADLNDEIIREHKLIVNCTPLGTFPDENTYPDIPYEFLGDRHILFDLVYNPEETLFMLKGKQMGAAVVNGYEMLCLQANEAWNIWNA